MFLFLNITLHVVWAASTRHSLGRGCRRAKAVSQGIMRNTYEPVLGRVCSRTVSEMSVDCERISVKAFITSVFSPQGCLATYLWAGIFKAMIQDFLPVDFTALLAGLLILIIGREIVLNGKHIRLPFMFCLVYGMFVGSLLLSSTYSTAPIEAVKLKLSRLVVVDGLAVIATLILITDNRKIETFMRAQIVIGVVFSLFTIVGAIPGQFVLRGVGGSSYIGGGRAIGLALGFFACMFRVGRVSEQAVVLILTMGLLCMSARGPFIASLISCFALMLYKMRRLRKPSLSVLAGLLVVVTVLLLLASQGYFYTMGRRLASLASGIKDASFGARVRFAKAAEEMFFERPLFGWGLASFPSYEGTVSVEGTPHNMALELLCESGIVGFLAFVLLLTITACRFFANRKRVPTVVNAGIFYALVFWLSTIPALDLRDARAFLSLLAMINAGFTCDLKVGKQSLHNHTGK